LHKTSIAGGATVSNKAIAPPGQEEWPEGPGVMAQPNSNPHTDKDFV
jgi:hypothetical protein